MSRNDEITNTLRFLAADISAISLHLSNAEGIAAKGDHKALEDVMNQIGRARPLADKVLKEVYEIIMDNSIA